MINSVSGLEVMAQALQRANNWKQFKKWQKSFETGVAIDRIKARYRDILSSRTSNGERRELSKKLIQKIMELHAMIEEEFSRGGV